MNLIWIFFLIKDVLLFEGREAILDLGDKKLRLLLHD